jgi:hypothetical protein
LKRFITIIFFLQVIIYANGQDISVPYRYKLDEYTFHFGFCLGVNMMNFIVQPNYQDNKNDIILSNINNPNLGFQIQIITNLRLGEFFDLRFLPGISFGERDLSFFRHDSLLSTQRLESNFLDFPFLLKYKAMRLGNIRPYILTGFNPRYDLAKTYNENAGIYLALKKFDIYYEAGAGIDFYLEYFKFSTEIKYSLGFRNMIDPRNSSKPEYENSIANLRSSIFLISFCFE